MDGGKEQLIILKDITIISDSLNIDIWLKGGWAIDFLLKKITREHSDIDIVTFVKNREKLERELIQKDFIPVVVKEPFQNRQSIFLKEDVEVSFGYLDYNSDGDLIMHELPEWVWRKDSLTQEPVIFSNISIKLIHPKQLLEEKLTYSKIGYPHRQKDEESKKLLRKIIEV
ncbi:nucleotidyltransferase domain-containing protein [Oceanobacillus sp. 1P07AA]|uniref:nucleotidyltransferase domain-containing protein n=1 Tax=Oceanobacillus sp. 1P07AA TaxID=3132293 RepID=UPI0039A6D538